MPRERRDQDATSKTPVTDPEVAALVAAAIQLAGPAAKKKKAPKPVSTIGWQIQAWAWYDTIGEFRYACNWVGNLLSRVVLGVEQNGKPTSNAEAQAALALLFGGAEGQKQMLRQMGIHYTVAGECYVIGEDGGDDLEDKWYVAATTKVTQSGDIWKMGKKELDDPLVIKTWKPHPADYKEPDAPTRAVLNILAEIEGLTKHVAAQIDSRLASAGLLLIPSEISFTAGPQMVEDAGEGKITSSARSFAARLTEVMMTAIADRESAAALVPPILQGKGDELEKIRHLTMASQLSAEAIELRKEAIRRLALGMDMPPEVLTGTADMNHWGSWQMEEAQIKGHIEPLLEVLLDDLTVGYLRPFLVDAGMSEEEAQGYSFSGDTSALRMRPNRSKEAIELYNLGELAAASMLRENGFEEADAMDEDEKKLWITRKLAMNTPTPEGAVEAARLLGIALPAPIGADGGGAGEGRELTPTLREHPVRELPTREAAELDAAAARAEMVVHRALERAGNRMKGRGGAALPEGVAAADLYRHIPDRPTPASAQLLLADAWTVIPRFDFGATPQRVAAVLHAYTTDLLVTGKTPDYGTIRDIIELLRLEASA